MLSEAKPDARLHNLKVSLRRFTKKDSLDLFLNVHLPPFLPKKENPKNRVLIFYGGSGGIRTHEALSRLTVFKTVTFNRSVTLPSCTFANA